MYTTALRNTTGRHAPTLGDVGETVETREYEPLPETAPVHEPSPEPAPAEPIPA